MTMAYQPMTMASLAVSLAREPDERIQWKYVWEFLEEYRWEPAEIRHEGVRRSPPR
jgi:hypothetical protein